MGQAAVVAVVGGVAVSRNDAWALAASYIFAVALLAAAQAARSVGRVPQDVTRKLVHMGAGAWCWAVVALFDSWQVGIVPFASFIAVNAVLYATRWVSAIDSPDRSPGTVYFAVVITGLFALLWRPGSSANRVHLALAGIAAMTFGDAMAALVGVRLGRHRYRLIPGVSSTRSLQGSAAMFAVSFAAVAASLHLCHTAPPGSPFYAASFSAVPLPPPSLALYAAIAAGFATLVEAASPHGTDNVTIPIVVAALLGAIM